MRQNAQRVVPQLENDAANDSLKSKNSSASSNKGQNARINNIQNVTGRPSVSDHISTRLRSSSTAKTVTSSKSSQEPGPEKVVPGMLYRASSFIIGSSK